MKDRGNIHYLTAKGGLSIKMEIDMRECSIMESEMALEYTILIPISGIRENGKIIVFMAMASY